MLGKLRGGSHQVVPFTDVGPFIGVGPLMTAGIPCAG